MKSKINIKMYIKILEFLDKNFGTNQIHRKLQIK